ncbi:MAG: hypothetical protein JXA37_08445 [Chloroflexia bacterium]|nr:hypothetical protein [Chloroflexia bacterium]
MKKHLAIGLLSLLLVALAIGAGIVLADEPEGSSANYALNWDVIAGGGNEMSSTHYAIKSTTGQSNIGLGTSSSYSLGAGYWYGIGERIFRAFIPLLFNNSSP